MKKHERSSATPTGRFARQPRQSAEARAGGGPGPSLHLGQPGRAPARVPPRLECLQNRFRLVREIHAPSLPLGLGGLIAFVAGLFAWRSIRKAEREAAETGEPMVSEEGPLEFRPLGLIEPSPVAEPQPETDERGGDVEDDRDAGAAP